MFNPFTWLRSAARDAVIGGISDALEEVSTGMAKPPASLAQLETRLAIAARGTDEPESDEAAAETVAGNGRKRKTN